MGARRSALAVAAAGLLLSAPVLAFGKPFTGAGKLGPLHWKDGATINVYIPPGPHFDDLKAGVLAWNSDPSLQGKKINITVTQGTAPSDPAHPGQPAPGTVSLTLHPGNPPAGGDSGTGGVNTSGAVAQSGHIDVYEGELDTGSFAKKLATHEMGHVLCLDDSTLPGEVMLHDIVDNGTGITADDAAELKATYFATSADSKVKLDASVDPLGGLWRYNYDATWLGGASLAVFQVALGGSDLISATAPDGWRVDDFAYPSDAAVNLGGPSQRIVGFILADETSYLGPGAPTLHFSFVANHGPGEGAGFLNGALRTLAPVPEPAAWLAMLAGFGLAGAALRRGRAAASVTAG